MAPSRKRATSSCQTGHTRRADGKCLKAETLNAPRARALEPGRARHSQAEAYGASHIWRGSFRPIMGVLRRNSDVRARFTPCRQDTQRTSQGNNRKCSDESHRLEFSVTIGNKFLGETGLKLLHLFDNQLLGQALHLLLEYLVHKMHSALHFQLGR